MLICPLPKIQQYFDISSYHSFISTFCSTSNGNILPFFACLEKTKNPDSAWKSGFYRLLLFFKVVPPGIE